MIRFDRAVLTTSATALLALAAVPGAGAQRPPVEDTVPSYEIEGVTVTVGRATADRDALPRRIEVVTGTELQRTAAADVAGLLKQHTAADVIEYPGLLAGVGLRGFRPEFFGLNQRTLVLIDGRPAGASNLALLDLRGLERVEVLKGPASALYGSNAMGGVVNLISRHSEGALRSSATFGYGSWQTREGSFSAGGSLTPDIDFDLRLSAFERGSDYRVGDGNLFRGWLGDSVALRVFADSTALSPELGSGETRPHTQYGTRSGHARLGFVLAPGWRLDLRGEGLRADRVQTPDDLFSAWGDTRSLKDVGRSSADLALTGAAGHHALSLRAFAAEETGDNYNQPDAGPDLLRFVDLHTRNAWRGVQVQDALEIGAHTLVAGFDLSRARSASQRFEAPGAAAALYEPDSETTSRAVFAEARVRAGGERLVATLGGRLDHIGLRLAATELADFEPGAEHLAAANRESFTVLTPGFGLQYTTRVGLRLHGSAGRAFVTPSAFNVAARVERRGADGGLRLTRGNPDLAPESSFTWDLGVGTTTGGRLELDANVFRTRVRDRIVSRTIAPDTTAAGGEPIVSLTTYVNAEEAEMRGVEWRLAYDLGAGASRRFVLRPFVNATQIGRARETVGGAERRIRNVADLTLNYGIDFDDLRRFGSRLSGRYVGGRVDDDWNVWPTAEVHYPPFMTLDWSGELRFADRFRLGLLVSNVTDENYYEVRGYPLPGRAARLTLNVNF